MILTGYQIAQEVEHGTIVISPFNKGQINPNSYNYRLGDTLKFYDFNDDYHRSVCTVNIPEDGFSLVPQTLYLGHTYEIIGSCKYAMSLIGRSSMGRYGLFLQVSANLGHTTSSHKWTLEIYAVQPIRVYPGMVIGQVSFWKNKGRIVDYGKRYALFNMPQETL